MPRSCILRRKRVQDQVLTVLLGSNSDCSVKEPPIPAGRTKKFVRPWCQEKDRSPWSVLSVASLMVRQASASEARLPACNCL